MESEESKFMGQAWLGYILYWIPTACLMVFFHDRFNFWQIILIGIPLGFLFLSAFSPAKDESD